MYLCLNKKRIWHQIVWQAFPFHLICCKTFSCLLSKCLIEIVFPSRMNDLTLFLKSCLFSFRNLTQEMNEKVIIWAFSEQEKRRKKNSNKKMKTIISLLALSLLYFLRKIYQKNFYSFDDQHITAEHNMNNNGNSISV